MSTYHRSAVYRRLCRYLGHVQQLKEYAFECNVIDDIEEEKTPNATALPMIEEEREKDAIFNTEGEQEAETTCRKKETSLKMTMKEDNDKDKDVLTAPGDHATAEEVLEDDAFTVSDESNTTLVAEDDGHQLPDYPPGAEIKRSQLERLLACHRSLSRIVAALRSNIKRLRDERHERQDDNVQHYYREAARLNGSEPIKSPRTQKREWATEGWWGGDEEGGWGSPDKKPASKTLSRSPTSPLRHEILAEDLIWEDLLHQWQLDAGRGRDDAGRRVLKL